MSVSSAVDSTAKKVTGFSGWQLLWIVIAIIVVPIFVVPMVWKLIAWVKGRFGTAPNPTPTASATTGQ